MKFESDLSDKKMPNNCCTGQVMMLLRSLLFNIAFWLLILCIGLGGLPFTLVYRPFSFVVARGWAKGSLWLLRVLCNIRYEIKGAEYIPDYPALIASKHQSAWDTIIFWALLEKPAFVLKRELIFFPVFGWYLIFLQNIYIDRKSGASAMKKMLREARERSLQGRPIVIFPEGTRTLPGSSKPYHPGVAALYQNLNIPVVPVALNSGKLWQKNAFVKKPGVITIEFLPPLLQSSYKSRDFLALLQKNIEEHSNRL